MCLRKKNYYVFFYNLKQLELIFIFFKHDILILLALECMHNIPPHLSYVATLPENTLI